MRQKISYKNHCSGRIICNFKSTICIKKSNFTGIFSFFNEL
jgi:hypothetical protein